MRTYVFTFKPSKTKPLNALHVKSKTTGGAIIGLIERMQNEIDKELDFVRIGYNLKDLKEAINSKNSLENNLNRLQRDTKIIIHKIDVIYKDGKEKTIFDILGQQAEDNKPMAEQELAQTPSPSWDKLGEALKPKQQVPAMPPAPKQTPGDAFLEGIEEAEPVLPKPATPPADNPMAAMMAEMLKPYMAQSEINQAFVDKLIDVKLSKHSKEIVIKKQGAKPKPIGRQHPKFEDLLTAVSCRINTLLVGPAGSGKTTGAHKVAEALDLEFYSISVGMMTTKTDFLGYMDANGNYVPTQFRKAFEQGGVFLLDEFDAGNANVITTINMALANGHAAFPDGMIQRHDDFVLIAAGNTFGTGADRQYVGRNQLDAATLDRLIVIDWAYDEMLEREIAGNNLWVNKIQAIRRNADKYKIRHVVSPRMSIHGAQLLSSGMPEDKVIEYVVTKGLPKDTANKLLEGVK